MYSRRHFLLYYYKYKDSPYFSLGIFLVMVLVALLLLMKVVLPQMYNWFSINSEVEATRERIATIDSNIAYINSLDQQDLTQKRAIFIRALPYEKDIQGILTTISTSATNADTELEDFSLSIGDLTPKTKSTNLSSIRLTLSAKGSAVTLRKFISNLQTRLPLVEVANVAFSRDTYQVSLLVFFKPIPIFKVNDAEPIQKISGKFNDLYTILSEWEANTDSVGSETESFSPKPTLSQ